MTSEIAGRTQAHVHGLTSPLHRLVAAWEKTQVELHGQYSLQRLKDLNAHVRGVGEWKNTLVYLLTPVPCLVLVALLDCSKLDPPVNEAPSSAGFWLRLFYCLVVIAIVELVQMQAAIPVLLLDARKVIVISIVDAVVGVATTYGWARLIGFPVPFTFPMLCPTYFCAFMVGIWYYCGGIIRSNRTVQNDVKGYIMTLNCRMGLTMIYPMYAYVFTRLSSNGQTVAVLLLPIIKIVAKNAISSMLNDQDDMKPESVIFNIEIFHALYLSFCMGNSTSILTTVALMAMDFVQAWLSLNDMKFLVRDLNAMLDKMTVPHGDTASTGYLQQQPSDGHRHRRHTSILDAAAEILERDSQISRHASLQAMSRQAAYMIQSQDLKHTTSEARTSSKTTGPRLDTRSKKLHQVASKPPHSMAKIAVETSANSEMKRTTIPSKADVPTSTPLPDSLPNESDAASEQESTRVACQQKSDAITAELGLNELERLQFIQKTTKVLFMTEFAALIEYTEVVTPVIYCTYMLLMFYLPNRPFYLQIAHLSRDQLFHNLKNVLLYASLELLSFLAMAAVINRQLGISRTRQLTFVLKTQWRMVQSKFLLWVMYITQTYLFHVGADFSFKFEWLSKTPQATPSA